MAPLDIIQVLTAAAPIAASVASIVSGDKSERIETCSRPSINVTINNNFYISSKEEALSAANRIQDQAIDSVINSGSRYII